MAYQALYRTWRPDAFTEVEGQPERISMVAQDFIKTALCNQVISGHIGHAYLFCGSRGTGKTSAARIFARAINCEHPIGGNPCGRCPSCEALAPGRDAMDLVEMDAASNRRIEDAREVIEQAAFPPILCRYKVYIVDEVHMLTTQAFNALLKTLEEPPEHLVFILATTNPEDLPTTIASRCQRYDFGRIPSGVIARRLKEIVDGVPGCTADDTALSIIAQSAEGGMRDAISLLDMCLSAVTTGQENARLHISAELARGLLGASDRGFVFRFTDALIAGNPGGLLAMIDEMVRAGREPDHFAREMVRHLRALLIAKACPQQASALLDVPEEDARQFAEQAGNASETRLLSIQDLFLQAEKAKEYASPRIALESAALKACLRTGETDTAALEDRIAALEKGSPQPAPAQAEADSELQSRVDAMEAELTRLRAEMTERPAAPAAPASAAQAEKPAKPRSVKPRTEQTGAGLSSDEVWKKTLEVLKREDAQALSLLGEGVYMGCKAGVYHWHPKSGTTLLMMFNGNRRGETIGRILTEISGTPSRFEAVPPDAPALDDSGIEEMRNIFGAENVSVIE